MKTIVRCHPLDVVDVGGTVQFGPVAVWTAPARKLFPIQWQYFLATLAKTIAMGLL